MGGVPLSVRDLSYAFEPEVQSDRGIIKERMWVAVQVHAGAERSVSRSLAVRGYESFLPLCKTVAKRSGCILVSDKPLFPSYVFCRYMPNPSFRIVEAPGVIRIVGIKNRPSPIPDEQ